MRTHAFGLALLVGLVTHAGCGGSDKGTPLVAGQLTGDYEAQAFTPSNGFATLYKGKGLIALGDGPIHCGTETAPEPPSGTNAILSVPTLTVGSYSSVGVQLLQNNGSFHGVGSNSGTVTLTSVTPSVAGTVTWDYTSTDGKHYAISGSFDVVSCAP